MTVSLNKAQKLAVRDLRGKPYGVIGASTARALISKGVASRVNVQPEPLDGIAVTLTHKGRSINEGLATTSAEERDVSTGEES